MRTAYFISVLLRTRVDCRCYDERECAWGTYDALGERRPGHTMTRVSVATRPNVLLIMVDQLAAQWLPAYGHSVVHAPELARLGSESVVFGAAYCASPLCAPSRAALLCGRRASAVGVFHNAAGLRASAPTPVPGRRP